MATTPWNIPAGLPDPDHPVSVHYTATPLDPAKTVQFITLPNDPDLHLFAMAVG